MADTASNEEEFILDLNKMKIADLKRELHIRGLKISGNKSELMERLQKHLEEHEGAEIEDDEEEAALLAEEPKPEDTANKEENGTNGDVQDTGTAAEPVAVESTVAKVEETATSEVKNNVETSPAAPKPLAAMTEEEKREARAKKFGLKPNELSEADRKEARAKKFGLKTTDLNDADRLEKRKQRFGSVNGNSTSGAGKLSATGSETDKEKLKKRAERFGSVTSSTLVKDQQQETLEKRKKRFGNITNADSELEIKKAKRAERFKNVEVAA